MANLSSLIDLQLMTRCDETVHCVSGHDDPLSQQVCSLRVSGIDELDSGSSIITNSLNNAEGEIG